MANRRRPLLLAGAFALAGAAILIGLGAWQLERLAWKNDIIGRIEARTKAAAKPLPPEADWPGMLGEDHEYERLTATGIFERDREALIYRPTGRVAGALAQPGYWVMVPLRLPDGSRVLVNRGFIALDRKDDRARRADAAAAATSITGLYRLSETRGAFTPPDNSDRGEWFTRDVAAIGAALGLDRLAPFSLDEEPRAAAPGLPAGGATTIDIPNNHLSYALTWFGLAAALLGVFIAFAMRRRDEL